MEKVGTNTGVYRVVPVFERTRAGIKQEGDVKEKQSMEKKVLWDEEEKFSGHNKVIKDI